MGWKWKSKLQRQCQEPEKDEKIIFLNMAVRIISFGRSKIRSVNCPREIFYFVLFSETVLFSRISDLFGQPWNLKIKNWEKYFENYIRCMRVDYAFSNWDTPWVWLVRYEWIFSSYFEHELDSWAVGKFHVDQSKMNLENCSNSFFPTPIKTHMGLKTWAFLPTQFK